MYRRRTRTRLCGKLFTGIVTFRYTYYEGHYGNNVILILTRRRCRNVTLAMAEVLRRGGSGCASVIYGREMRLREHVPDATSRRPHLARLSPDSAVLIPGGAIDVAARLTRTCRDTRRRQARTCERRRD